MLFVICCITNIYRAFLLKKKSENIMQLMFLLDFLFSELWQYVKDVFISNISIMASKIGEFIRYCNRCCKKAVQNW